MFEGLLGRSYYGNTVLQWLTALVIVLIALLVGRALYWATGNVIKKLTDKTKTRLDDLVVDMVEEPVVLVVTVAGAWIGIKQLALSVAAQHWVDQGMRFIVILTATWLVTRLLDALCKEYLVPLASKTESELDDQLLPIVRKGGKLGIWALGLVVALNNAGYDVGALIAGLGIGGLALAMAAKDTVSNVFGGFTILADRPFKLNDRVKISGFDGFIRDIGVRSTRLETLDGTVVTIPNAKFADSPVENVSLEPSRKVTLNLGLTYDTSPAKMREALEILKDLAAQEKRLEPKANATFNAFGDSAMNVVFVYFIRKDADILATQTTVNLAILERFSAAGLELAYPTRTLYTKQA